MADDQLVIALADKNLGPVGVELTRYIRDALVHLSDRTTYAIIPEERALREAEQLSDEISNWIDSYRGYLGIDAPRYLRKKLSETADEPFGYFYLLYKLHKTPVKTRPVCSDCASLTHALGQWVDEQLQPIVKAQHTYFKNSFELKEELLTLKLPYRKWSISDKTYFPSHYAANKEKPRDLSSRTNRGLIGQIAWFLRDALSMQFHFRPLFFSRENAVDRAFRSPNQSFTAFHVISFINPPALPHQN